MKRLLVVLVLFALVLSGCGNSGEAMSSPTEVAATLPPTAVLAAPTETPVLTSTSTPTSTPIPTSTPTSTPSYTSRFEDNGKYDPHERSWTGNIELSSSEIVYIQGRCGTTISTGDHVVMVGQGSCSGTTGQQPHWTAAIGGPDSVRVDSTHYCQVKVVATRNYSEVISMALLQEVFQRAVGHPGIGAEVVLIYQDEIVEYIHE